MRFEPSSVVPHTAQTMPPAVPSSVQVAGTISVAFGVCGFIGTSACATSVSPQTEQCLPSVRPVCVQVASFAGSITYDGTTYQATIVGVDEDNDIALLKVDASGVTPVTFGDSDSMSVGDTVYAVGNPLGELEFTMTSGMISALDRTITTSDGTDSGINMFQIDAAVNAGNSGGPVYNTSGQVIGIVTAKYSSSGVEGLGFAIPVNDAVAIANDLMKNGTVTDRAQLGITLQTIPDSAAQYYNMPDGAYVNAVNSGSCAEKAGLKAGDIITAIDDTAVSSGDALRSALRGYSAGESATLTVSRSGETLKLTVTFDRASDSTK